MTNKKYTRKEFLKYAGKIGLGATIWGAGGNLIGRGYKSMKDFYQTEIEPIIEKGEKIVEKGEEIQQKTEEFANDAKYKTDKFFDYFRKRENKKYTPEKESKRKEEKEKADKEKKEKLSELEKKVSRRGFFQQFGNLFHQYPLETGTTTGVIIGGGKKAIGGYFQYNKEKKVNQLYRDVKELKEEVIKLKNENNSLKETPSLEKKISNDQIALFSAGLFGVMVSALFSIVNLTGFIILNDFSIHKSFTGIILLASLVFLFISELRK